MGNDDDALGGVEQFEIGRVAAGINALPDRNDGHDFHHVADLGVGDADQATGIGRLDRHADTARQIGRGRHRNDVLGLGGLIGQIDDPQQPLLAHGGVKARLDHQAQHRRVLVGDLLGRQHRFAAQPFQQRGVDLGAAVQHDPQIARALEHRRRRGLVQGHRETVDGARRRLVDR